MAKYVVPPKEIIVMCYRCRTMYVPDREKSEFGKYCHSFEDKYCHSFEGFEPCPVCGYKRNGFKDTIPLWKYNLIKLFRGGFRK